MIPFNSAVAAEVRSLVQGADDSNIDSIYRELCQLADCTLDGCILLLQVCLDEVLPGVGVAKNSQSKQALLSTIFRYCLDKPYFSTCFCEALRIVSVSDVFLETLSNELDLSRAERVGIGLSLSDSDNIGLNLKGQRFSIAQIEELCENPSQPISNDQIHDIIVFLHHTDGLSKHIDSLTNIISLFKVRDMPFHVPVPIQDDNVRPASRFSKNFILICFSYFLRCYIHVYTLAVFCLADIQSYLLVA
jgi:CCR4-NOT transcription complex subunit 1